MLRGLTKRSHNFACMNRRECPRPTEESPGVGLTCSYALRRPLSYTHQARSEVSCDVHIRRPAESSISLSYLCGDTWSPLAGALFAGLVRPRVAHHTVDYSSPAYCLGQYLPGWARHKHSYADMKEIGRGLTRTCLQVKARARPVTVSQACIARRGGRVENVGRGGTHRQKVRARRRA